MRLWEKLETGLRHQGRITSNYLLLMAVGGIIAAAGVLAEPAVATVAYVASSIGSIVSRIQLLLADQVVAEGVASDSPAARDALIERTRTALAQLAEA